MVRGRGRCQAKAAAARIAGSRLLEGEDAQGYVAESPSAAEADRRLAMAKPLVQAHIDARDNGGGPEVSREDRRRRNVALKNFKVSVQEIEGATEKELGRLMRGKRRQKCFQWNVDAPVFVPKVRSLCRGDMVEAQNDTIALQRDALRVLVFQLGMAFEHMACTHQVAVDGLDTASRLPSDSAVKGGSMVDSDVACQGKTKKQLSSRIEDLKGKLSVALTALEVERSKFPISAVGQEEGNLSPRHIPVLVGRTSTSSGIFPRSCLLFVSIWMAFSCIALWCIIGATGFSNVMMLQVEGSRSTVAPFSISRQVHWDASGLSPPPDRNSMPSIKALVVPFIGKSRMLQRTPRQILRRSRMVTSFPRMRFSC